MTLPEAFLDQLEHLWSHCAHDAAGTRILFQAECAADFQRAMSAARVDELDLSAHRNAPQERSKQHSGKLMSDFVRRVRHKNSESWRSIHIAIELQSCVDKQTTKDLGQLRIGDLDTLQREIAA